MSYNIPNSLEFQKWTSKKIIQLAHENNASHVGGSLSVVDILSILYSRVLNYDPINPNWEERDRLYYSKGHACLALYATLCKAGFYSEDELNSYTKNGSNFTSHVNHKIPGIELSTGSLGHALSVACGVALAGNRKKKEWKTFCIISDGELNEGSNWEALLFAPHNRLNNLTVIVDYNKIQSFGMVKDVLNLEPLSTKLISFGWDVLDVDGHDHELIFKAIIEPSLNPKIIIANTIKGKGVPFMENQLSWHYKSPNKEEMEQAIKHLDN